MITLLTLAPFLIALSALVLVCASVSMLFGTLVELHSEDNFRRYGDLTVSDDDEAPAVAGVHDPQRSRPLHFVADVGSRP